MDAPTPLTAILKRCDTCHSTENLGEVTLIGKSGCNGGFAYGVLRITQVLLRALNSALQDISVRSQAGARLEKLAEIMRAHSCNCSEFLKMQISRGVLVYEVKDAIEAGRRHPPSTLRALVSTNRISTNQIVG